MIGNLTYLNNEFNGEVKYIFVGSDAFFDNFKYS